MNFGEAKFILGMDIVKNKEAGTISLSQEQYIKEILEKYGMLDITPSKVPMAPTHYRDGEVASDHDKVALTPSEHETFRAIRGSVNFLCMCTRHDIAFAINVINRRHAAPTQQHMKELKSLLRYLNGTKPIHQLEWALIDYNYHAAINGKASPITTPSIAQALPSSFRRLHASELMASLIFKNINIDILDNHQQSSRCHQWHMCPYRWHRLMAIFA
jgi:hypothetical protein